MNNGEAEATSTFHDLRDGQEGKDETNFERTAFIAIVGLTARIWRIRRMSHDSR